MTDLEKGQVSRSAAEVYEAFFVPSLFAQWTDVVLDAAGVAEGHSVLDVGCGTGVLTRAALARTGVRGLVAGADPNEGMLAVAARSTSGAEWKVATAEELPFENDTFDRVVSQFALMFFTNPAAALREMARVTRPQGRMALAVWGSLESNPGYAALTALVERLFGSLASDALRPPFALGDPDRLETLVAEVVPQPAITEHQGVARFDSLAAWLHTEIRGWTLADLIDDDSFDELSRHAEEELRDFVDGGRVAFPVTALVVGGEVRT